MGKVADLSVFTPGGQPGAPNPSEGLAALRQNQTAFMETIGVMPPESLTIVDGAISPTTAVCIVDTEGGAPADDLTTINATLSDGSTLHDGMVILLSAKDASRVVTVKNSDAPNGVKTVGGKDIALSTAWSLVLQYVGGTWQQISISAPLKPATKTTLGGVKVGDGLTIGEDGTLSLDLVDSVNSTSTTQAATANAVKISYDKGVEAKNAADAAQKTADEAKEAADNVSLKIVVRAIRNSPGSSKDDTWTITGVDTSAPLFITHKTTKSSGNTGVYANILTGSLDGSPNMGTDQIYVFGNSSPGNVKTRGTASMVVRPSNQTLTLSLYWVSTESSLTAWQYV